jgi:UDP-N-acetylmuramate--alanine ligase
MAERTPLLDLTTPTSIHIVGVGGAGMSALALVLAEMGHQVSGSDLRDSSVLATLRDANVRVEVGHRPENLGTAKWVTASPAVPANNPELVAAHERGCFVLSRAGVLGALTRATSTLAVTGTHGKTTTSSMLSLILVTAGKKPSFVIGAELTGFGVNAHFDAGGPLVLEADESYGSFGQLEPAMTGITSVEADHLDHYGTLDQLEAAFGALCDRTHGPVVIMGDDPGAARVGRTRTAVIVGQDPRSDVVLSAVRTERAWSSFTLAMPDGSTLAAALAAPGLHNVRNAAVASVMASLAGVGNDAIAEGLKRFAGVPRRYEFRGEADGITFVDDYAHLPSEVEATVAAAKAGGFERIICVFQPHRYTRTHNVGAQFAHAFDGVDHLVVTPIYASGETPIPGVTGKLVADAVAGALGNDAVTYVEDNRDVPGVVDALLGPGDLCLTLGAGDLTLLPDVLIEGRS